MKGIAASTKLYLLLGLTLVLGDGWLWLERSTSRAEADFSAEQIESVEHLATQIRSLRSQPERIDEHRRSHASLANVVESAVKGAGLSGDRLVHVSPGEPRRIADTPYLEQVTEVELREITLRQFVEFALGLSKSAQELAIGSLSLRMPPVERQATQSAEAWNVQLTLTSRSYAPTMPASSQSLPAR